MSSSRIAIKTIYFSIAGSIALALIKGIAGILGHSHALIADAIESTTDVFSSLLVLFGLTYAKRPPDENHPYGHGKIEPLITFLVVGFLITSAVVIAWQSIQNIQSPQPSPAPWTLLVLGLIIIWKELSYRFVMQKSRETHSTSLRADAWHHRSDAITSVTAFIGIAIAVIFGEGYETADDWAALVAAAFILYSSYLIFRPALGEVMDEHRYDALIDEIRHVSISVDGILGTEKCFVRKSGTKYHIDIHAIVDADITVRAGHHLAHVRSETLRREIPGLAHISVHVEPGEHE
jgi:cation diffusion facilitator family transporter